MIIRKLRSDEAYKAKMLMGCAFNYSVDGEAERTSSFEEEGIGAFCDDNETLMAQLVVKPYKSFFCGNTVDPVGIAGVSTYPEYRRNGCIKALFNEVFNMAPQRGWLVSYLYPFSYRYYRKYGYEALFKHKTLTVPFDMLTHIDRNSSAVLYTGQPEIKKGLLQVYNAYAAGRNVCFYRTDAGAYSDNPVKSQRYTYLWNKDNVPKAYATVKPSQDSTLEVIELVYTDVESLYGILGFLRLYDGQFKKMYIPILEYDSPAEYLLDSDRNIGSGCYDGVQGRIIDIKTVLELNKYPEGKGNVRIKVYGDFISRNNGIYDISFEGGKGRVVFEKEGDYDIAVTVQSFSRLVFGDVSGYALPYLNGIEVKCGEKLKTLAECFPRRALNLFERF